MADRSINSGSVPSVVYHYTTMEAMMNIVKTGSIWATSVKYLNDTSEGDHFLNLVCQRIPTYLQEHEVAEPTIFDEIMKSFDVPFVQRPFVASFTTLSDSLSHWRSYCPNGNGVSIGFRVECLKRAVLKPDKSPDAVFPTVAFYAVDYVSRSDVHSIDSEIESVLRSSMEIRDYSRAKHGTERFSADTCFMFEMRNRACAKKHDSFKNEQEYRVVVDGVFNQTQSVHFRPTRSMLVPYVPVSIPRRVANEETAQLAQSPFSLNWPACSRLDFIDNVVIGPTPNKNLSKDAVSAFFQFRPLNVEIVNSDIPYRDW